MLALSKETKLSADEILERASQYFDGKIGLTTKERIPGCCAEFSSDLGFVAVQILDNGVNNEVILTTREFEYQVQYFMQSL